MTDFQKNPGSPKDDLRAIRIIFAAIIAGALIFALITLVMIQGEGFPSAGIESYQDTIFWIAAGITLLCFILGWNMYKKRLAVAKDSLIPLNDKLNHYRAALILYIALCEGPALFGIILFFITGYYYFLVLTGLMIVAMLVKMPTLSRVTNDLGLDWQQQQEFE